MHASATLYGLLYRSRAAVAFDDDALAALLARARRYNQQEHLSGLLLHYQNQFLQVLEGPEPALSRLYSRIQADWRHRHVRTLCYGPIERRAFPDWRMGFAPADGTILAQVTGFLHLMGTPGLTAHPPPALTQLLRDFVQDRAADGMKED